MGPGTWGVKVGVFPTGPCPQTVPAARQPRLAQRAGFWAITACSPRPQLGRDRVKRLPSALYTGGADPEVELCQLLSPPPCGLGMAAGRWASASTGEVGATPDSKDRRLGGGRRAQLWPGVLLAWQTAGGPEGREPGPGPPPPPSSRIHQGRPAARAWRRNSLLPTVATTNSPWN